MNNFCLNLHQRNKPSKYTTSKSVSDLLNSLTNQKLLLQQRRNCLRNCSSMTHLEFSGKTKEVLTLPQNELVNKTFFKLRYYYYL